MSSGPGWPPSNDPYGMGGSGWESSSGHNLSIPEQNQVADTINQLRTHGMEINPTNISIYTGIDSDRVQAFLSEQQPRAPRFETPDLITEVHAAGWTNTGYTPAGGQSQQLPPASSSTRVQIHRSSLIASHVSLVSGAPPWTFCNCGAGVGTGILINLLRYVS